MIRRINRYGGGARTNENGLRFEQGTQLNDLLSNAGYRIIEHEVYLNNTLVGYSTPKRSLYSHFLQPNGIDYTTYNSKRWEPDDLFININTRTAYVIEKKFQNGGGSVDEKLGNCEFKKARVPKVISSTKL